MGNVLYEAHAQITSSILTPLIIPVFFFYPLIQNRIAALMGRQLPKIVTWQRTACITFGCIAAVLVLSVILFQGHMYLKTVGAYRNGQYETVEGYVENFDPMPYEGHANESFEINGVYFEYSDFNVTSGYRTSRSHGGVITGDGQYLKIGYVYYNSAYGNIIVYIEELPAPHEKDRPQTEFFPKTVGIIKTPTCW